MTATSASISAMAPAGASSIPVDLPDRVSAHMHAHFPDDVEAAGWICARDNRDGTVVVVWRPSNSGDLLPGGSRAIPLYRWHESLQDAGFACIPRTDMEVFGRPDEQSPDGRAQWLHVTGWDPDLVLQPRTVPELVAELKKELAGRKRVNREPVR